MLDSGDYGTIDDLTYSYEGNQVVKIDDAADESPNYSGAMHFRDAANEETEYTYDANGNMLTDSNKGITSIDYNVLDLPQCIKTRPRIIFKENTGNAIYYTYSADGTKLCATYKEADSRTMPYKPNASYNNNTGLSIKTNGIVTPMVRSLESNYHYCSNLVYNNDRLSTILFDGGYASVDEGGGIVMHFYVKDHLGSNRLVVDGNGNIEEVNHYYPFGALMGDRCGVSRNKYKYIGKELDTMYGWNMQNHEARWYDPVLGRWVATDPLEEKYPSISSYSYVLNNPIIFIDPEGKEWKYTKDKNGNTIISVDVILQIEANLSPEQISAYKASITFAFNNMLMLASNNKVSGEVTFEGNEVAGIHTPTLTWYSNKDSKIAGITTLGSSTVNILNSDNTQKTGDEFASDVIHELLHTLRLVHPFEVTQTADTELLRTGKNSYISTQNTVSDIRDNIMNYNMILIDGKSFKETNPNGIQNKITLGQIDLMIKEIDLQQKGAGANGDCRYWSEYSGYDVKSKTK